MGQTVPGTSRQRCGSALCPYPDRMGDFNRTLGMDVGYDVVVWGYVLIVSIWDMVKKDRFCIPILAIGTAAQALARLENQETLSFSFFCLFTCW